MTTQTQTIRLMTDRGLTIPALARLAGCKIRQAEHYSAGTKNMSRLEILGLTSLPRKRGPKKKQ